MATPYSVIYNAALGRFSDYDFLPIAEFQRTAILLGHLRRARSDFINLCKFDLSKYDDDAEEFEEDLDEESIEILALGVSYHWLSSKVLNSELFRNVLNTKDFSFFSPGSLLNNLRLLRSEVLAEYKARMVAYSYDHGDIATLRA